MYIQYGTTAVSHVPLKGHFSIMRNLARSRAPWITHAKEKIRVAEQKTSNLH